MVNNERGVLSEVGGILTIIVIQLRMIATPLPGWIFSVAYAKVYIRGGSSTPYVGMTWALH